MSFCKAKQLFEFWADAYCVISKVPTLILDRGGTCIGVVAPPCEDPNMTEMMSKEIRSLIEYGSSYEESKRGDFEILELGFQKGPGSRVSQISDATIGLLWTAVRIHSLDRRIVTQKENQNHQKTSPRLHPPHFFKAKVSNHCCIAQFVSPVF